MNDWTAGYVADISYTYGYYSELNPQRLKLAFLNAGIDFPEVGAACELGFGQGMSANIHASASTCTWHGNDFNPAQAAFARELAAKSGNGADLTDEAFAQFFARDDLPGFDFIGLHGIWSWISDENRRLIVDFIGRKLNVGGVLYISYNTLPGWATFAPVRHLLTRHAESCGGAGSGIVSRIDQALEFSAKLLGTNPSFLRANPSVEERLGKVAEQNRNYLAHEYFNRDWHPMYFADMAAWLEPAKVQYACSANYLDHIDVLNMTDEQSAFLKGISDPLLVQTVRDFVVNQQFRKDYWVKGARTLSLLERSERLRAVRIQLVTPRHLVALKAAGSLGEANLSAEIYGAVLDLMADHAPRTLGEIEASLAGQGISLPHIIEVAMILGGTGALLPVGDDEVIDAARDSAARLNAQLMDKARGTDQLTYLASPVTGGGVVVSRFHQLFILAMKNGLEGQDALAGYVWSILSSQGQALLKDGAALQGEDNLNELKIQAKEFIDTYCPVYRGVELI